MNITIQMEEITIVADFVDGKWIGECSSETKKEEFSWTPEEFAAVMNLGLLAVGEEELEGYDTDHLYKIAEEALAGWKSECRPIP